MGLFNRNKNVQQNNGQVPVNNVPRNQADLSFEYSSGIKCEVQFTTMRQMAFDDGVVKMVQDAVITYHLPNGRFEKKNVTMDALQVQNEQGEVFWSTSGYYKQLAQNNKGLVKGFFKKEDLDTIENGYIGYIGNNPQTGKPTRAYSADIKEEHDQILAAKKENERIAKEQSLQQQLQEQTQKIENMEINVKDSHAKVLTKEDYEKYFGGR